MEAAVNPTVSEIFYAVGLAWRDMRHVFEAMYKMVVIAFVITAAIYVMLSLIPPRGALTISFQLVILLTLTTHTFLITPYLIAVHRLIILGELTTNYQLTPDGPRFLHFFGWSFIILALTFVVPSLLLLAFLASRASVVSAFQLIVVVVSVGVVVVPLRAIIIFPAVAVDAPGASWSRAMADTKGYAWRIYFIVVLATFPLVLVSDIVGLLLTDLATGGPSGVPLTVQVEQVALAIFRPLSLPLLRDYSPYGVTGVLLGLPLTVQVAVLAIFNGAIRVIGYTLAVVVASRLYERLGDRVKQPG
jgi:hypothetical protein